VPELKASYLNLAKDGSSRFAGIIKVFTGMLEKSSYKLTDEADKYRKGIIEDLK
jgi:hypothetical protein